MSKKGKNNSNQGRTLRKRRIFSETFKQTRVKEIESGLVKVAEVSRLYKVHPSTVYNWLYRYSKTMVKGTIQVIQMESESHQKKLLLAQIKELEAALGRKQLALDYLEKLVSLASEEFGVDLKKNFATKSSTPSTKGERKEATK